MTVSVKARLFDDGTIKINSDEDITEKLRPLRGNNVIITFEVQEELPKFKDIIGLFKDEVEVQE